VARRIIRAYCAALFVMLMLPPIGSFVLPDGLGPAAARFQWICGGLALAGAFTLYRMCRTPDPRSNVATGE
jgi:hypothetical protein